MLGKLYKFRGQQFRKLLNGEKRRVLNEVERLPLDTHCPSKYAVIDMETGDLWTWNIRKGTWRHLTSREKKLIEKIASHQ